MLEVLGLVKGYGERRVIDGLSLKVDQGETVVLMGPSGCGKSTTLRAIHGLVRPDGGQIFLGGRDILELPPREMRRVRRRMGIVFQDFGLIRRLSLVENICLSLVLEGMKKGDARVRARKVLRRVGLDGREDASPQGLSGGEAQRVAIARALALEPEILLLDEPTAALDPIWVGEVLDVLEEISGEVGMLVVTHEMGFAQKAADRILLMDQGRIVEEGDMNLFRNPSSTVGKAYARLA